MVVLCYMLLSQLINFGHTLPRILRGNVYCSAGADFRAALQPVPVHQHNYGPCYLC
jgi:hypothetical protein